MGSEDNRHNPAEGTVVMGNMAKNNSIRAREIMDSVFDALTEKGYKPINQLVGYILSGDPTYITNHRNARSLIRAIERDELLEEVVKYYIQAHKPG